MNTEAIPESRIHRWGGAAFVLGNLLFIVNKLDEMNRLFFGRRMPDVISEDSFLLIILGQVALIAGYVAYYQFYSPRAGSAGKNALRLFSGGGIVLALGHVSFMDIPNVDFLFLLVFVGLLVLLIGLIWFGILNFRQPVLSHWRWLPLATGLMGFIGFFLFGGEEITAIFLLFRTLFALGLIGLGVMLGTERPVQRQRS
jgi:hypothetical protein